jgi:putative hemolysin
MNLVVALIVVFVCGAFFSAMETAFTAFDRILAITWLRARKFGAQAVDFLTSRPERFLGTTLIGNNLANVAYSSLLVIVAHDVGFRPIWLVTVSPLFVLVFSEILPKMMGYALANRVVRGGSIPILVCYHIFLPLRILLLPLMRLLSRASLPPEQMAAGDALVMRRDLDQILVGAEAEGAATPEEGELLARYLDARELKVRQIMTPRTQMTAVSADASPEEVREIFRKSRYNLLPVYERDVDHVVGYINARDFLLPRDSVREVMRPLHAVPESKRIVDLLEDFKTEHRQAAIVVDEYGGTDGLVTIKDVFEELVGPVAERWDPTEPVIKRIALGKFLISGSALLEEIEAVTGWVPPAGDYNTLGGLLSERLGRIAEAGEDVDIDGVIVRVIRRTPRLVEGCLVKLPVRPLEGDE